MKRRELRLEWRAASARFVRDNTRKHTTGLDVCCGMNAVQGKYAKSAAPAALNLFAQLGCSTRPVQRCCCAPSLLSVAKTAVGSVVHVGSVASVTGDLADGAAGTTLLKGDDRATASAPDGRSLTGCLWQDNPRVLV